MSAEAHRSPDRTGGGARGGNERLTLAEAEPALYVDFEGREGKTPVILGVLCVSQDHSLFRQFVVDARFEPAARAKNLEICTVTEAIHRVASEASQANRRVVAWSAHELTLFEQYGSPEVLGILRRAYCSAIPLVRAWRARFHPGWKLPVAKVSRRRQHTLAAYELKMGYVVPTAFGPNNTGQRLAAVEEMLKSKGSFGAMTPTVKGKWTKVLKHNEHDCFGMRFVCLRAAADLEVGQGGS